MTEIVKQKNNRSCQNKISFLCATWEEVERICYSRESNIFNTLAFYECRALGNLQCYLEQELDKTEFKLKLVQSRLVNKPSCPISKKCYSSDFFISEIILSLNKDGFNRVKLSNRGMFRFIQECVDGRLLTIDDFILPLNTN